MATTTKRRRLSVDDWIDAATAAVRDHGVDAIAVEPLAERLGVTKGSFYAHFAGRDDLLRAVLDRWVVDDAARVAAIVDSADDARATLRGLLAALFGDYEAGRMFAGVCAAGVEPVVSSYALDHALRKLELLADLYRQVGLTRAEAQHRAELTYSALIGHWRVKSLLPPDEPGAVRRYVAHLDRTLVPGTRD